MIEGSLSIDDVINQTGDSRELKRGLSVKKVLAGAKPEMIGQLLNVSEQYVSKWKRQYENGGAEGLRIGYQGRAGYLRGEEQNAVIAWIKGHKTLSVEEVCDYVKRCYGVIYQSKQSYYALLEAGEMSYHRSEKVNPRRDEAQVMAQREALKKTGRRPERD